MDLIKLIILSIIQGISEILPISSSGHIIIFKELLKINTDGLSLEVFLHLGSLIAVLVYYFNDISSLIRNTYNYIFKAKKEYKQDFRLFIHLIYSTIITCTIALLFKDYIEIYLSNIKYLPIFFTITALLLFLIRSKQSTNTLKDITIKDSLKIGLMQGVGIIPGISRSGITFFSTKLCNLKDKDGFKYTFFLFIPITLGSFILKIPSIIELTLPPYYYIISIITTFVFTLLALLTLKRFIKTNKLYFFSYYLLIMTLFIITYFY